MDHGFLSNQYRINIVRPNIRGQMIVTEHMAATFCVDDLCKRFGAVSVLRNGPRILKAMATVRAEVKFVLGC